MTLHLSTGLGLEAKNSGGCPFLKGNFVLNKKET